MTDPYAPSTEQTAYVKALQKKLRITDSVLDGHCQRKYDGPFAALDRRQVSWLIYEMKSWQSMPAELMRDQGQLDLFEVHS